MTDTDEEALEKYNDNNNIDEKIFENQRKEYIKKAINNLKEPYKSVIYDYYILEKNLDEISINKNISKGTVKMQLHRGKKILKESLEKTGGVNYYV